MTMTFCRAVKTREQNQFQWLFCISDHNLECTKKKTETIVEYPSVIQVPLWATAYPLCCKRRKDKGCVFWLSGKVQWFVAVLTWTFLDWLKKRMLLTRNRCHHAHNLFE